jgi:hypothetical protein
MAACPANLVTADQIWQGRMLNQEFVATGDYVLFVTGITTNASCYVDIVCEAGAGFKDHATVAANALEYDATKGAAFRRTDAAAAALRIATAYTRVNGLQVKTDGAGGQAIAVVVANCQQIGCIAEGGLPMIIAGTAANNVTDSCVLVQTNALTSTYDKAYANYGVGNVLRKSTLIRPSNYTAGGAAIRADTHSLAVTDCLIFGYTSLVTSATGGALVITYSGTDQATMAGTGNLTSLVATDVFEQPNATTGLNLRIKSASTTIDAGTPVGYATDIHGKALPQGAGYDMGAWEYPVAVNAMSTYWM